MATADRFELRNDLPALRRYFRIMATVLVLLGAVQTAAVGMLAGLVVSAVVGSDSSSSGMTIGLVSGAVGGAAGFLYGYVIATTGVLANIRRRLQHNVILVLDAAGVWMPVPRTRAGEARLPWPAVGEVVVHRMMGNRVVVIKARPGVPADLPGAAGLDDPAIRRAVHGRGLFIGTRFTTADADTVLAAVEHFRRQARQLVTGQPGSAG